MTREPTEMEMIARDALRAEFVRQHKAPLDTVEKYPEDAWSKDGDDGHFSDFRLMENGNVMVEGEFDALAVVRAVIRAMHDATPDMIDAGDKAMHRMLLHKKNVETTWYRAVINAASPPE